MPTIPVALSDRSIPGTTGSPNMPGEDPIGAAFQKSGAQIEAVANQFLAAQRRAVEQIKAAEDHVEVERHKNGLRTMLDGELQALSTRTDYENFDADAEKKIGELTSYVGNIQSPIVRMKVEAAAQDTIHQYKTAIGARKVVGITDRGKAVIDQGLGYKIGDWVVASPEERTGIKADMISMIQSSPVLKETEKVNLTQQIDQKLDQAYAAELQNTNPLRLKQELEEGGLPNLDPVERQHLIASTKAKAKNQTATSLLIDLKRSEPDVEKRLAKIESPEFLESLGDDGAEIQNTLLSYTLREAKIKDDAYKKLADDKIGKISVKVYAGTPISPEDLDGLNPPELALVEKIKDYQVRQDRAEIRERRVADRQVQIERREARYDAKIVAQEKSDSLEGAITAKIINQDAIDITKDIYSKIPEGLSPQAVNRLTGMVGKVQKDPAYKLGLDVINKAFPNAADTAVKGRMIIDLRQQVEDGNLKGKQIIDAAALLAEPKKKESVGEMLNNIWKSDIFKGSFLGPNKAESKAGPGKIVGTKDGKNVYELPDGKWKVGD